MAISKTFKDILDSMECMLNLAEENPNADKYKEQFKTYEMFLEMLTRRIDKMFGSNNS